MLIITSAPVETLPFVKDIPVSTKAAWKDIRHSNIEYTQVVTKHKGLYIIVATLETKIPTGKFAPSFYTDCYEELKGFLVVYCIYMTNIYSKTQNFPRDISEFI